MFLLLQEEPHWAVGGQISPCRAPVSQRSIATLKTSRALSPCTHVETSALRMASPSPNPFAWHKVAHSQTWMTAVVWLLQAAWSLFILNVISIIRHIYKQKFEKKTFSHYKPKLLQLCSAVWSKLEAKKKTPSSVTKAKPSHVLPVTCILAVKKKEA